MIAVLGASGTIGRSLARKFAAVSTEALVLFARNTISLDQKNWPAHVTIRRISEFNARDFDLVINAVGAGDPARVAGIGAEILDVTQAWDQKILSSMGPHTRYVFLSSGAIYGHAFAQAVEASAMLCLPVNRLGTIQPYLIAKLYAEMRHRHASDRAILDVRIFGFADASISTSGTSFLADLTRAVCECETLMTSRENMVRDYAGVDELHELIHCWLKAGGPNRSYDLYTLAPVSKRELLRLAAARYNLEVQYMESAKRSQTSFKAVYASSFHAAAEIGYKSRRTAADVVIETLDVRIAAARRLR